MRLLTFESAGPLGNAEATGVRVSTRRRLTMPFISAHVRTLTNGTRTAVIELTTHIRGQFSGPQRPSDTYYSVEGTDTKTPKRIFLPPGCETEEQALAYAIHYVGEPVLR